MSNPTVDCYKAINLSKPGIQATALIAAEELN